jgi:hypothetical protein
MEQGLGDVPGGQFPYAMALGASRNEAQPLKRASSRRGRPALWASTGSSSR